MAKQMVGQAKFQVPGGQATPAPPVGTSLGRFGINLGQFVQQFNDRTREAAGMPIPVVVTVYNDRSFDFITKSPPAAALLKKAAGLAKGSSELSRDAWNSGRRTPTTPAPFCSAEVAGPTCRGSATACPRARTGVAASP